MEHSADPTDSPAPSRTDHKPSVQERTTDRQMVRVRLDLAYDGSAFHGWAAQPGLRTVEGVLTAALTTVLRQGVRLTVAGRTDAGVHAAAQVAHLDLPQSTWNALPGRSSRDPQEALMARLTGVLVREAQEVGPAATPKGASDLVVRRVSLAPPGFDARFSARSRRYAYRVADGGPGSPARLPHRRHLVLWLADTLDVEAMNAALAPLLGEHDFLSYCRPREGATTVRTLERLCWSRLAEGEEKGLVVLEVVADAFCHSMVRSLVGASLAVGRGRRPADWPARLLQARSRMSAAPVAPPHGLSLEEVVYPADEELAAQAGRARVRRSLPGADCC